MFEEENISPHLSALKKKANPYQVPANYFEDLPNRVLQTIEKEANELSAFPLLSSVSKDTPYQVPTEYFEKLEKPAMVPTSVPYRLPEGYFENFGNEIIHKKDSKQQGKLISFGKWYKIAAAVVLAVVISVTVYQFTDINFNSGKATVNTDVSIKKINTEALALFIDEENIASLKGQKNSIDDNQLFKNISNTELQDFLTETGADGTSEITLN